VVGLGYVGTVTAACLACRGHDVRGVDVDAAKVGEICVGRSPVAEPGQVESALAGGLAGTGITGGNLPGVLAGGLPRTWN